MAKSRSPLQFMRRSGLWPFESLRPASRFSPGDLMINFYRDSNPNLEQLLPLEGNPSPNRGTTREWVQTEAVRLDRINNFFP